MRITLVAGARPNFMKIAPIIHAIKRNREQNLKHNVNDNDQKPKEVNIGYRLVHTGQHYDRNMSDSFFEDLNIPEPDINLGCCGGTQAEQTASIMVAFEKELMTNPADLVMVVGDVTSTMACSIVAKKMNTKVAHIEAGLRSFDLTMPEEINRMVTDCLTDYFFTTSEFANKNLKFQGVPENQIYFVGNVMIDTLISNRNRFRRPVLFDELDLNDKRYFVLTLHRPANVDEGEKFKILLNAIIASSKGSPIIFPVHPRTAKVMDELNFNYNSDFPYPSVLKSIKNLYMTEPLGYLEFNYLVEHSLAVITDSGGVTEETTFMGVPCITLRNTTERPETISSGTNELIGNNPSALDPVFDRLFAFNWKKGGIPELWDGKSSERIIEHLKKIYG